MSRQIHPCPIIGGVYERLELRFAVLRFTECNRVREPRARQLDLVFDWPGSWSRFCGQGSDVRFDRGAIEEALFEFRRAIDIAELIGGSMASGEGFEWGESQQPRPTVFCPTEPSTLSRRRSREFGSRFDHVRLVGRRASGAGAAGRIVSLGDGLTESASRSVCPVVDMAAEDSDGVASLSCRFSRNVVLNPQSSGGTQRSVQIT